MKAALLRCFLGWKDEHCNRGKSQNVGCGSSSHSAAHVGVTQPSCCDPAPGARTVLSQRALSSLSAQVDSAELRRLFVLLSSRGSVCGSVTYLLPIIKALL